MQITHNGKTYKWIGGKWGMYKIENIAVTTNGEVVVCSTEDITYYTKHTPEQLVKLGYMVNITDCDHDWNPSMQKCRICRATRQEIFMEQPVETKPCEHPSWQVNGLDGKAICSKCGITYGETKPGEKPMEDKWTHPLIPIAKALKEFNKKPDHDKAMDEVHGVEEEIEEVECLSGVSDTEDKRWKLTIKQLELLRKSLNAVIKKINNL